MTTEQRSGEMAEAEAQARWTDGERWRNAILTAIGMHTGVWPTALCGRSRVPEIAQARQIACLLLREEGGLSATEAGRLMERDHSTAIHACHATHKRMSADRQFRRLVADIRLDANRAYLRRAVPHAPETEAETRQRTRRQKAGLFASVGAVGALPASGRMGDVLAWDTRGLSAREVAEAAYWRRRARERQRDMLGYAS